MYVAACSTFNAQIIHKIPAYLRDILGSVPNYGNKGNIAIKRVTQIFWFPSAHKSYVYTKLYSIKYAITLCLKLNIHTLI